MQMALKKYFVSFLIQKMQLFAFVEQLFYVIVSDLMDGVTVVASDVF